MTVAAVTYHIAQTSNWRAIRVLMMLLHYQPAAVAYRYIIEEDWQPKALADHFQIERTGLRNPKRDFDLNPPT